jgi:hypothetical protein
LPASGRRLLASWAFKAAVRAPAAARRGRCRAIRHSTVSFGSTRARRVPRPAVASLPEDPGPCHLPPPEPHSGFGTPAPRAATGFHGPGCSARKRAAPRVRRTRELCRRTPARVAHPQPARAALSNQRQKRAAPPECHLPSAPHFHTSLPRFYWPVPGPPSGHNRRAALRPPAPSARGGPPACEALPPCIPPPPPVPPTAHPTAPPLSSPPPPQPLGPSTPRNLRPPPPRFPAPAHAHPTHPTPRAARPPPTGAAGQRAPRSGSGRVAARPLQRPAPSAAARRSLRQSKPARRSLACGRGGRVARAAAERKAARAGALGRRRPEPGVPGSWRAAAAGDRRDIRRISYKFEKKSTVKTSDRK